MIKNNNPLLSIIIPFYNVEKFIAQCLDSVYNQDIPESDYEVICVNDASPDKSRDIVLEYQKKHSNLILVEHEVNKKLGAARNTGRAVAKGKYIWNVDSDDMIQPNALNKIIRICESENLDVLIFNFDYFSNSSQRFNTAYPFINSEILNGIDFIKKYCIGNFAEISPIWTQVYLRKFLDDMKIYSPPINMGEDVPFTLKTLLLANRIKSTTDNLYIYRVNENSLTGAHKLEPTAEKTYENCIVCSKYVFDVIDIIPQKEKIINRAYTNVAKHILYQLDQHIKKSNSIELNKLRKKLKKKFLKNRWIVYNANFDFIYKYIKFILFK